MKQNTKTPVLVLKATQLLLESLSFQASSVVRVSSQKIAIPPQKNDPNQTRIDAEQVILLLMEGQPSCVVHSKKIFFGMLR